MAVPAISQFTYQSSNVKRDLGILVSSIAAVEIFDKVVDFRVTSATFFTVFQPMVILAGLGLTIYLYIKRNED